MGATGLDPVTLACRGKRLARWHQFAETAFLQGLPETARNTNERRSLPLSPFRARLPHTQTDGPIAVVVSGVAHAGRRTPPPRATRTCLDRRRRRRHRQSGPSAITPASARTSGRSFLVIALHVAPASRRIAAVTGVAMTAARHASERGQCRAVALRIQSNQSADGQHGQNEQSRRDGEEHVCPPTHRTRLSVPDRTGKSGTLRLPGCASACELHAL